jgi:hypothetical protein
MSRTNEYSKPEGNPKSEIRIERRALYRILDFGFRIWRHGVVASLRFALIAVLLLCLLRAIAWADSVVVFNEIMYHPATNEAALEWVELYNQNSVDVDLSGWRMADGIQSTLPNGTVIRGGGYLVVAIAPDTLKAQAGVTNVVGPYTGRLSNSGERLELRDNAGRLMDLVNYGVDGDWPLGPDGGGVSLAKQHPDLASRPAENWTVSREIGGTPGAVNFSSAPLTGGRTNPVAVSTLWRYDDTGTDLDVAWRQPGFDDSAWRSGPALFYAGDPSLPSPGNTPLTPGRNTYYFRTRFTFDGDPAQELLSFRSLAADGAVIYLNGQEVYRLNMPTGAVSFATMASSPAPNPAWSGPVSLPSGKLAPGQNVLAVELHRTTVRTNAGLKISRATGFNVTWDGGDGDFYSAGSPALAPSNAALAALGVDVITTSNTNQASALNDGRYGSESSWSPAPADTSPSVILRFNQTVPVASIAWSRDNGNTNEPACGGTCADRALGNYTVQYTLAPNPAAGLGSSTNPTNGWVTVATVQYLSTQPGFTPCRRHRFNCALTNGNPLFATGIRLKITRTNTLDEIEVNTPMVTNYDAAFGFELRLTDILAPPPKLAFNEVAAASASSFWLEIINCGDAPAALSGVTVLRTGGGSPSFTFPAQALEPGGIVSLSQAQLGLSAADGQRLFLYAPGRFLLLDAVTAGADLRGRHPDGNGGWRYPALPTPGASNVFAFHDEIVFNEIMYHHRPIDPTPGVTSNLTLAPVTGLWRYNDSSTNLGAHWISPAYDDRAWPAGPALLYVSPGVLPVATNTALTPGRTTYYFRTSFNFSGAASHAVLNLQTVVDDGAIFYLNGVEVYRLNMPAGPVSYWTSAAAPVGDATFRAPLALPVTNLVQGVNVLAVEVHQSTAAIPSSGIVLAGAGLKLVEEGPFGGSAPLNLARQPGAAPFVIDSLAGYPIHDFTHLIDGVYGNNNSWIGNSGNPGYAGVRFGGLFTINGIAFGRDNLGTVSDRTLGLYTLQYTRVANPGTSTPVTTNADTGWATIGTLNYQNAGTGLFTAPSRRHRFTFNPVTATGIRLLAPATGIGSGTCIDELEVNPPDTSGDIAFGAELALSTLVQPPVPFTPCDEEWIELYNRGTHAVDLSGWRLDGGVRYQFPAASSLSPGGYLVVARDAAALRAKWPEVAANILGDFSGRMKDNETVSLLDQWGNPANTIRIRAGGWSDGGGSSLELTDPRADNTNPGAWADSDEGSQSAWQNVTYRMVSGQKFGATQWNEFRLDLLDVGEALVDEVRVIRDPDGARQQLIQNGDFEATTGNTHWRMLGDHGRSRIIPDPDSPAHSVLRVVATAPPRTSHNHIESTFVNNTPLVDGRTYEVGFRARWLAGSPQLHTTAYMAKLARVTILPVPSRHGTPGAVNSRRAANAGPTLSDLKHSPVIPPPTERVTISVRVGDPDGVASVTLNYRANPATNFASLAMAPQTPDVWTASLPAQVAGKIVQFYVSATDSLGASAQAPPAGPDSRALYQVADAQGTKLPTHELRLIQLDRDRDFVLNTTNVMSQDLLGGTLICDRAEVFYDVGVRLHGSAAGRARDGDDYISYTIAMPPGHLFRGVQPEINIDRSGRTPVARQQDEIYVLHLFHRAAVPCHYSDLCYFIAPKTLHTGTAILQLTVYGGLYAEEQYGVDGSVFNYDLTYEPSTTVGGNIEGIKLPVPLQGHLGTDFADLGDDKEQYRVPFDLRHGTRSDDYAGVIRLCQTMALPQAQFDAKIPAALEVDKALRLAALYMLCGIGDIYFSGGLQHNLRLYTPVNASGPAHLLPWDMDFVFYAAANSPIYPTTSYNFGKLILNPTTKRLYLSHVYDLCQTAFTTSYLNPWLVHYGSVAGQTYAGQASYIDSRRSYALGQMPAPLPFAITCNGGNDFSTNATAVTIAGQGWIDVRQIRLAGDTNLPVVTWPGLTNWQTTVFLRPGTNLLTFQAYGWTNNLLAADNITVTLTSGEDTDGDGMPDAWELAHGLEPRVNDANLDSDGEGLSNLQEYLAGTDPGDPRSYLKIDATMADGLVQLTFLAAAGHSYSVLAREAAASGAWTKVADEPARETNRVVQVAVPQPGAAPRKFYRLVTPQQP